MDMQAAPPTYAEMNTGQPPVGNPPVLGQQVWFFFFVVTNDLRERADVIDVEALRWNKSRHILQDCVAVLSLTSF